MKIFVNNIYSTLKTEDLDILKAFGKKYSCKLPGYQYTPQYKSGWWKGDKQYFSSKTGKFGTGLLKFIQKDLDYIDRVYDIEDSRQTPPYNDFSIDGVSLRPYQETLVSEALNLKTCIIQAPTGAGKTIVLASLLKACEDMTGLVFFTKKQLLHQTYEYLQGVGIDCGIAFGEGVDIKPITLCTVQSVAKVLDSHLESSDFIIFDEVHEFSKGKLTTKVVKSFPNASIRIGMTATPPTDKFAKLNVCSFLGPVVEEVTAEDLINLNFLTKPTIRMIDLQEENLDDFTTSSYLEVYQQMVVDNEERNEIISDIALAPKAKNTKVLILTNNLKHSENLHKLIPEAYRLEGSDSLDIRNKTVEKFRNSSKPSIIIGTVIFQTGIDIPELTHLINARGLRSDIATIQALGRTLRKHKNKEEVFIYDFIDKVPYLIGHSKKRIQSYKSLGFEVEKYGTPKRKRTKN